MITSHMGCKPNEISQKQNKKQKIKAFQTKSKMLNPFQN